MTDLEDKDYSFNPLYIPFKLEMQGRSVPVTQHAFYARGSTSLQTTPHRFHLSFAENVPSLDIESELEYTLNGTTGVVYTKKVSVPLTKAGNTASVAITSYNQVSKTMVNAVPANTRGGLRVLYSLIFNAPLFLQCRITTQISGVVGWMRNQTITYNNALVSARASHASAGNTAAEISDYTHPRTNVHATTDNTDSSNTITGVYYLLYPIENAKYPRSLIVPTCYVATRAGYAWDDGWMGSSISAGMTTVYPMTDSDGVGKYAQSPLDQTPMEFAANGSYDGGYVALSINQPAKNALYTLTRVNTISPPAYNVDITLFYDTDDWNRAGTTTYVNSGTVIECNPVDGSQNALAYGSRIITTRIITPLASTAANTAIISNAVYNTDYTKLTFEAFNIVGYNTPSCICTYEVTDNETGAELVHQHPTIPRSINLSWDSPDLFDSLIWDYESPIVLNIQLRHTTIVNGVRTGTGSTGNTGTVANNRAGTEVEILIPATLTLYPAIWSKEFQPPIAL